MLRGVVKPVSEYTGEEIRTMYLLMDEFYDNVKESTFRRDFFDKDYCLALYDDQSGLVGFTTQKVMQVSVDGRIVHGMFSGDTIIHKEFWGEIELFRVWARFWFPFAEQYEEFYWFLICKGYKTYRILPLFWTEFYPNADGVTPDREKRIINAYAQALYPQEYNPESGVIEYRSVKDKLKAGVADVGGREMKKKETAFFCKANPGYIEGNDLACLAKIDRNLLKKRVPELLFE